jgi:hypothetical protein
LNQVSHPVKSRIRLPKDHPKCQNQARHIQKAANNPNQAKLNQSKVARERVDLDLFQLSMSLRFSIAPCKRESGIVEKMSSFLGPSAYLIESFENNE